MNEPNVSLHQPALLKLALLLTLLASGLALANGWHAGFKTAQALSSPLPGWFWESATVLGDERVLLALFLPFCRRYPRLFWSVVLAAVLGGLLCRGIKIGLHMPRPALVFGADEMIQIGARLSSNSFPSGHTVSAFAFATVCLGALGWRQCWSLLLLAGLAGFSRVAVGAHWPLDTMVGAVIGVLAGWVALRVCRHWHWGVRSRPHNLLLGIAVLGVATLPFDGQGYPESLSFRLAVCLWGLSGFFMHYLLPHLRTTWQNAGYASAPTWAVETE